MRCSRFIYDRRNAKILSSEFLLFTSSLAPEVRVLWVPQYTESVESVESVPGRWKKDVNWGDNSEQSTYTSHTSTQTEKGKSQ
jgi:hypothetical protein